MGRETKYTPAIHEQIVEALRFGAFRKHAANAARVSDDAFADWIRWGGEGREPYATFARDVEAAIAEAAIRDQSIITKAAIGKHAGDWKAAAWNLEKKFPRLYGSPAVAAHEPSDRAKPFSPWKKQPSAAEVAERVKH